MNKISTAFNGKKALVCYLMAGDPNLEVSAELILTVQEAGADLVEIGIPFSDPIAEGEVIEAASERALGGGANLENVFKMVESIKDKMRIPVVFMTYLNPVFVYGYERFFTRCKDIGVSGVIIPDLPYEEQQEAKEYAAKFDIDIITLVAPTSKKRIAKIAKDAEGFIYLVSSMGVTGVRDLIETDLAAMVADIREVTDTSVAVGFGISTSEQAKACAEISDGAIVGSAIVRLIAEHGEDAKRAVYEYVRELKRAVGN